MNKIVVANVQSYSMIGNSIASVIVSTHKVETAMDYANKIKDHFKGKLEVVPNTVRNATRQDTIKAVAFHVRAVTPSQPIEAAAQMRTVIEANVFADAEDATWEVVEAAGVKRLVKRSDTDVSALLAAASKMNINKIAASFYSADLGQISDGEFVLFTNPETASQDSGILVYAADGGTQVIARSTGKLLSIAREAIVAHSAFAVDLEEGDEGKETAALGAVSFDRSSIDSILSYYRTLYSTQPAFFAQLEAMVRKTFLMR